MTSSNGNIFRVTGPLWWESTGHRWIPTHKGEWRRALIFSLICARIKGWVNNHEAGDLRRHRAHYDVIVMNDIHLFQDPALERVGLCWHLLGGVYPPSPEILAWGILKKASYNWCFVPFTLIKTELRYCLVCPGWILIIQCNTLVQQLLNLSRSKPNGHHFTDDIIEMHSKRMD